jgi:hypothetical protein
MRYICLSVCGQQHVMVTISKKKHAVMVLAGMRCLHPELHFSVYELIVCKRTHIPNEQRIQSEIPIPMCKVMPC